MASTLQTARQATRAPVFAVVVFALAASLLLAACEPKVDVDAAASVAARYASVRVTVKEIWFNQSGTAAPADDTWDKHKLDKSVTIDLVTLSAGAIARIAEDLEIPAATYRQIRLLLASSGERLLDSASDLGADYNNEVTWFNEDGDVDTVPLEVLNADRGIGIPMELEVKEGFITSFATVQLLFDGTRDLTEFSFNNRTSFLLNPTLRAFDVEDVGYIGGLVNLAGIAYESWTGRPQIQVTAQKLDATLGRRVVVGSAAVGRSGTFALFPLPLEPGSDTTEYDVVISGPEIQTIVVQDVPVSEGTPGAATPTSAILVAPQAAEPFEANISVADPVLPRSARVGFYQTLPGESAPHLIDVATVDPLSGRFAEAVRLSRASTISYDTYSLALTLRSDTPVEGAARFAVAALSPHYGDGAFAPETLRPAGSSSDTAQFSVPAIGIPAGAVSGTIATTVTVETPGEYDRGVLLVSREGALVTLVPLDSMLQQQLGSAFVDATQVPAGTNTTSFEPGLYYLEAWTWNSAEPRNSFTRHPGTDGVDLRSSATATGAVTIQ